MSDIGFVSVLVIALGLSADCFAVALCGSLSRTTISAGKVARVALAFGVFQSVMTLAGWLAGRTVIDFIAAYDHWLAFALLLLVGGKMIRESIRGDGAGSDGTDISAWWTLLVLSVATSLDALAVGLSLAFLRGNIFLASLTIGLVALAVTAIGFVSGRKLRGLAGRWAEAVGGAILIIIGLRILLEHLL